MLSKEGNSIRSLFQENVVAFYNKRGTCEQWIKEGKGAVRWTRLSCRSFAANAVRLQLHALAYNLGNFLRTLATPELIKDWSLTSLKEKLIKIGAKLVSHGRYVAFQMAEVAIPRHLFADILRLIAELRPPFRAGVRGSAVVCSKTIGEVCLDDEKIAIFLCAAERDGSRRGPCARHRGINDAQICQTGQIERILRSNIPVIWECRFRTSFMTR